MSAEKMSIHGHQVMQMIIASGKNYTTASLIEDIELQFGKDACFHTCSAEQMDAAALVEFLAKKGKFIQHNEGFSTSAEKICNH